MQEGWAEIGGGGMVLEEVGAGERMWCFVYKLS